MDGMSSGASRRPNAAPPSAGADVAAPDGPRLFEAGVRQARTILHECITPHGFVAAPRHRYNYREIWTRDGVVIGLAALQTSAQVLHDALRDTLDTLARHVGPNGEIPSRVDPESGQVSLGHSVGRVDSDLWFIIGCHEYWSATGDDDFLKRMAPVCDRVRTLLHIWEFNDRGLVYIPQTGDWADEFIHAGYVLHDQVLYYYAQRALQRMYAAVGDDRAEDLARRSTRLADLIRANYWLDPDQDPPEAVYDRNVYETARKRLGGRQVGHWLSSFAPYGYTYHFDALANVLVSLVGLADAQRTAAVDAYIAREIAETCAGLLPAFWPVVTPDEPDWDELLAEYAYTFRNQPYHYQNGGLWPMVTGFYVADLARRGERDRAQRYLAGIHRANWRSNSDAPWGFSEYLTGDTAEPGGVQHLGWSAAGTLIGHYALQGRPPLQAAQ